MGEPAHTHTHTHTGRTGAAEDDTIYPLSTPCGAGGGHDRPGTALWAGGGRRRRGRRIRKCALWASYTFHILNRPLRLYTKYFLAILYTYGLIVYMKRY